MSDKNLTVSKTIVEKLKRDKLIAIDENTIEGKIAGGIIKEVDWKIIFQKQIGNEEISINNEVK